VEILDGEGIGTIVNVLPVSTNFMKVKIGTRQWAAGGFFGFSFNGNTFAGYGAAAYSDSQLSFVFFEEPTGPKTYVIEENGATSNNGVSVYFSPEFFSGGFEGPVFIGLEGGEFNLTKYDVVNGMAEGTFEFVGEDQDGNQLEFTDGSFKAPIE
jgi:hypothetical protein